MPAESGTKREHVPWLIPPAYSCTVVVVDEKKVVIANGKLSGGIENKQSRMNGRRAPRHAQYHGERHWFLRCSLLHPTSMTMACTNPCSYTYTRILRYMCGGGYCIYVLHSIPYQLLAWKGAMFGWLHFMSRAAVSSDYLCWVCDVRCLRKNTYK